MSIFMVYLRTHFRFRPSFSIFCSRPSVSRNSCALPLSTYGVSRRYINLNLNSFTITVLLKSRLGREEWVSAPLLVPAKFVKFDVRFLIFGENFLLLKGRKSIFLSASRSQFVAIGPAKILKIGQRITFYSQNEF